MSFKNLSFCYVGHVRDFLFFVDISQAGKIYPDDVGKAVSALALENFPYSTGQVIMIDGGITLSRF